MLRIMLLGFLVYQFAWLPLCLSTLNACVSHSTFREPVNTDIDVSCGSDRMEIKIMMCPVYFGGYNESLMAMNGHYTKEECRGTPIWTTNPPVLKFNFYITEQAVSACSNKIKIIEEVGTGFFSDFSNVQSVIISGIINSLDPSKGAITYRKEQVYRFSCRYPLYYLVNNTELSVWLCVVSHLNVTQSGKTEREIWEFFWDRSGVSLAVKDNNGSFVSTLSLMLFSDSSYKSQLQFPDGGVKLKTRIFVEVKATNLTERIYIGFGNYSPASFVNRKIPKAMARKQTILYNIDFRYNVLLDRCYATTLPYPISSDYFDLFVGCDRDGQTVMGVNGLQQNARFSFEAFRFTLYQNRTQSTYYLHCVTRLCDRSVCPSLIKSCIGKLRRRDVQKTSVSEVATVSSGPIRTQMANDYPEELQVDVPFDKKETVQGVAIAAVIVGLLCITFLAIIAYKIFTANHASNESRRLYTQDDTDFVS